jgi:hypothetical protein
MPSAAGWWFRSARLVPPGTVVEASVVGIARVAWSAMPRPFARSSPSGCRRFVTTAQLGKLVLQFVVASGSSAATRGVGGALEVLLANAADEAGETSEADNGCHTSAAGDLW